MVFKSSCGGVFGVLLMEVAWTVFGILFTVTAAFLAVEVTLPVLVAFTIILGLILVIIEMAALAF